MNCFIFLVSVACEPYFQQWGPIDPMVINDAENLLVPAKVPSTKYMKEIFYFPGLYSI